ncbi:TetR/AcrR family transcriptional regulator [Gordonia zhaorongruii]|uniref:TetR/AcrR family transcriptional regulator n=1 Tax=Gordonia zhaorongruii TaxID=2597659 RepID=UPI001404CC7C|nr:TetR family transcriptional regulator [Gordonia zhaorongruii]
MARWDPDASGRLERAAIELFAQHGYAATTVPQIAERARVTTRTFFRYFADKREVLFAGEEGLASLFAELIEAAPPHLSALGTLEHALRAVAEQYFEPRREWMCRWREIIADEPALQERGLSKQQLVVAAAVEALRGRGVDSPAAELAAGIAFVAFQSAVAEWATAATPRPLASYLDDSFGQMRQLTSDAQGDGADRASGIRQRS